MHKHFLRFVEKYIAFCHRKTDNRSSIGGLPELYSRVTPGQFRSVAVG